MSFRSQIYATLIVRLPKHFQPLFTSLEPLLSTLTLATIFSVVVSVIAIGILCYPLLVKWQRDRLMAKQFPKSWLSIIESNLSIYKSLTSEQQKELLGYIQVFLKEKQFIGCLGLQITEEIKVTIAAIACLLLFGDRKTYFPNLRSVLVYPHAYIVNELIMNSYVVEERRVARLGESWTRDQLVLSWEQIQQDVLNWKDGHNVILHEFAHQLDQEDGQAEGVPILPRVLDYEVWKQVMSAEYLQLCDRVENGKRQFSITMAQLVLRSFLQWQRRHSLRSQNS